MERYDESDNSQHNLLDKSQVVRKDSENYVQINQNPLESDGLSPTTGLNDIGSEAKNTDQIDGRKNAQDSENEDLPVIELQHQTGTQISSLSDEQNALLDVDRSNTRVNKRSPAIRRKKKSSEYRNVS